MKKILPLLILSISTLTFSQDYKSAYGLKVGFPGFVALDGKFYTGKNIAFDNYLGTNFDFEKHFITFNTSFTYNQTIGVDSGFNWYFGFGPTLNYYTKREYFDDENTETYKPLFVRADAVIGIESTPKTAGFNMALEAGPTFTFVPFTKVFYTINLSLRFPSKKKLFYITQFK
jgi:hypothetical protein